MTKSKIKQVENYAKKIMKEEVAHDFKHVDRVRNWALRIAKEEGYHDIEIVEVTALLHDVGLPYVEERRMHGAIGAEMATKFLRERGFFEEETIEEIANAIRYHCSLEDRGGKLPDILRDADSMDALGAVGIMRAFTSKSSKPEYEPGNVRGDTWGVSSRGFDERLDSKMEVGDYIIDQINFQISLYDDLSTETARRLAKPLVEFMKDYVIQLQREIEGGGK